MKKLLLILFLLPVVFAGWEVTTGVAVITAATLLALIYAVGFGLDITELKMLAKEEFFQLFALLIMMTVLFSLFAAISEVTELRGTDSSSIQEKADKILDSWANDTADKLEDVMSLDSDASKEASQAFQCSLFGMGYSVSSCGAFSMLNPPLGMAGGIIGFAYAEVSGMRKLVTIADAYALELLLPIGILLRTFKLTRGAGALFIALGTSLYIMLPLGIIFNEMLAQTFDDNVEEPYKSEYNGSMPNMGSCVPDSTVVDNNDDAAASTYEDLRDGIKAYLKAVLLRSTLGPVIALLIVAGSIRGLTSLLGAEIDVSAIARFT